MFGRSFRIATIRGIPVNVDSSWIWIAVLAVYTLTNGVQQRFGVETGRAVGFGVFGALLFFGSVFLHELAHAVTARLSGIQVDGITLVFFGGFTAARSEDKGPGPSFWISAFGPGTSLAIGAVLVWASRTTSGSDAPASWLIGYVGALNLFMAALNVLPGLPLDGGHMLQSAVWRFTGNRTTGVRVAARTGMAVGALLLVGAAFMISRDDPGSAIWLGIIGLFVFQGSRASDRQVGLSDRLAHGTVSDAMEPPPAAVPADLSLSQTLDRFLRGREGEAFPVVHDDGNVIGMISFSSARELGARDPLRPARDAMIPLDRVLVVHPEETLEEVSNRLGSSRAALVLRDGRLVGAITGAGLHRWAAARAR